MQREESVLVGLKRDVVGKLDPCSAVVVEVVVEVVAEREDFDSVTSVRIVLSRSDFPRVQEPAVAVVHHRAHGPIRPESELSLVGAIGVHRPCGLNALMDVIDGSAAGGRAGRGGGTD